MTGITDLCHPETVRVAAAHQAEAEKIAAELAEYQPLFDNAKKLRALLAELQDLTLEIIETDSQQP